MESLKEGRKGMNVKRGPGSDTERQIEEAATALKAEGTKGESVERGLYQGYRPWLEEKGHSDL